MNLNNTEVLIISSTKMLWVSITNTNRWILCMEVTVTYVSTWNTKTYILLGHIAEFLYVTAGGATVI